MSIDNVSEITFAGKRFKVNLSKPIDISTPLKPGGIRAFYADDVKIEPVVSGSFIGDVSQGGSVNFRNIAFNPHGNGTHTECVGHIHKDWQKVNELPIPFFMLAKLITPDFETLENGDLVITKTSLIKVVSTQENLQAIVIRTLPNTDTKLSTDYSGNNAPYFDKDALAYLVSLGIEHLLTDLPSVDREKDEGKLSGHKVWWDFEGGSRYNCTITELVYVPDRIPDADFLLNLNVANFSADASPSRPLLFELI